MIIRRLKAHPGSVLALSAVLSAGAYVVFSWSYFRIGFPLDDAWIHQTYARNLAEYGSWIYSANSGSGGSTSPLWTLLLSAGYLLGIGHKLWAYLLGAVTLCCTSLAGMRWIQQSRGLKPLAPVRSGLLIAFEWHLVWASVSGMETLLMGLLAVVFFLALEIRSHGYLVGGLLIGLGMWIRPDAILLSLPALWILLFQSRDPSNPLSPLIEAMRLVAGMALFAIPYLIFNQLTAGSIWPRTLVAKQVEYRVLLEIPLFARMLPMLRAPLVGVGILLLPAFLFHLSDLIRSKRWAQIAPYLWVGAYFGAYVLRLPVTYQHGRYLMPILPVSLVLGYLGFQKLLEMDNGQFLSRVFLRAWKLSVPAILIAFWVIGARAYAQDVAIIESEMVDTARWIRATTPSGAKIAAHDIGAVGYFAEREILDLAGLVSPEVIPIMRDEEALERLMNQMDTDYLMTFPGWYPYLSSLGEKVYESGAPYSPAQGGENMAVYRWPQ